MPARTPHAILETLLSVLAEHGLRGILIVPSTTTRNREFLQIIAAGYRPPEVEAILKEAVRAGESFEEAEANDVAWEQADSDEDEED